MRIKLLRYAAVACSLMITAASLNHCYADDDAQVDMKQRYETFSKKFSGAKLKGLFTIDGKPMTDLKDEAYEIVRATKMPQGDKWQLEARIKYGKNDLVVPILLDIKWAGDTPVITLDNLTIPGLGTFSSRVVLDGERYAGTWQHDDVGGHLFGKIILPDAAKADASKPQTVGRK